MKCTDPGSVVQSCAQILVYMEFGVFSQLYVHVSYQASLQANRAFLKDLLNMDAPEWRPLSALLRNKIHNDKRLK